jgi:DNA polymerase-3 subunit delta
MTPTQLFKEIDAGRFKPVYYFYGEEDYRKTEAARFIVNNFIPQQQRLLNHVKLSVDKVDFETVCNEIAAIPMIGERRCVQIDEVQRLKPIQQKRLYALLEAVVPGLLVILSSPAAHTPDRKSAFLRDVSKVAEAVKFDRLTIKDARTRITRSLRSSGFTYDAEAVDLLVSLTGGDFGGLSGELEKLALSSEEHGHIGLAEVKALVSSHEEFTIFELIDLIAAGNSDRAMYVCYDLVRRGNKPVPILRMLSRHLINLAKVLAGKKVAGHPFFVDKLRKQARTFDENRVGAAISRVAETERKIRHSSIDDEILLENTIRDISR